MKKIAYTGDVVLQLKDVQVSGVDAFKLLTEYLSNENILSVVNLESPFVNSTCKQSKNKICLFSDVKNVDVLKKLNPYLVNLSNNHINDFGNESVLLTIKTLNENNTRSFGVGVPSDTQHIIVDDDLKLINIAYTHISADQSGERLHSISEYLGPKSPSIEEVISLNKLYPDYKIIVSMHWGDEDITQPSSIVVELAHKLIDAGADMIVGHHPHIIQPIERYHGKYIFYSLGNTYFPEISVPVSTGVFNKKPEKHQKKGIIPIIDISSDNISVFGLIRISCNNNIITTVTFEQGVFVDFKKSKQLLHPFQKYRREKMLLVLYYAKRVFNLIAGFVNVDK